MGWYLILKKIHTHWIPNFSISKIKTSLKSNYSTFCLKINVFCIFMVVFDYFRVFILVLDPYYGVIRNPEMISYMIDTKFVRFREVHLIKIHYSNIEFKYQHFCIFIVVFTLFTVLILVVNLYYGVICNPQRIS